MDQKSIYQRQTGEPSLIEIDYDRALVERDRFVTEFILNQEINTSGVQANIIELSIGEGRLTQSLIDSLPEINLTCADISSKRIDYVRQNIKKDPNDEKVTFIECNFDTEFELIESSRYEYVIALDVMEHVVDIFNFIENCYRILKRQGVLFIRVPNIAYIKHRLKLLTGRLPVTASWFGPSGNIDAWRKQYGWDGGHLHYFTIPMLVKLIRQSGFSISQCRDPGASYSFIRDLWPNLFYSNPMMVVRKIEEP